MYVQILIYKPGIPYFNKKNDKTQQKFPKQ